MRSVLARRPPLRKLGLFAVFGGSAALLNTAIVWALTAVTGGFSILFPVVAALMAKFYTFTLNDRYTWGDRKRAMSWPARLVSYYTTTAMGSFIYLSSVYVLEASGLHYLLANALGIGLGGMWNFTANDRITWRTRHDRTMR